MSGEEILVCAVKFGENSCLYFEGNYYPLLKGTHWACFSIEDEKLTHGSVRSLGWHPRFCGIPCFPPVLAEQSSEQLCGGDLHPLRRMTVLRLWSQAVRCQKNLSLRQLS